MGFSRSGSNTPWARRALVAMGALGFSRKQSLAVLKRLVKVYDNKWALIEDDSYRVLIDAILDHQQVSGNGGPEPEQEEMDDDDIPAGGDPSTSLGPPSPPSPTAEQDATAMEMVVSPRPQARASTRARGKRRHGETTDADFQLEDAVFLREPKPEPVDMDAPCCQDVQPGLVDSSRKELFRELPLLQPDQNPKQIPGARNRTIQRRRNREMATLSVEPTISGLNNGTGSGVENVQGAPCLDIDVASSSMGEVKMSLKCSIDPSKFCMPSL